MVDNLIVKNPEFVFCDFNGKQGPRTFGIVVHPDVVEELKSEGWNVRRAFAGLESEAFDYLIVTIPGNYRSITMFEINKSGVELSIKPYPWEVKHLSGIKAYLDSITFTEKD